MKQKYFLVYTLWFASQIEFSDWDWLDLNIISRTIAVIHQFNVYLIFSRSFHFSNQHKTSCLRGQAPYKPKYNFSSENNVVGWMTISLIKNYVVFPVTVSNCFPHFPSTSTKWWLPKSKTQTSSRNKLWVHKSTQMEISWWLESGWESLRELIPGIQRRLGLGQSWLKTGLIHVSSQHSEVKEEGLWIWGRPPLYCKFLTS